MQDPSRRSCAAGKVCQVFQQVLPYSAIFNTWVTSICRSKINVLVYYIINAVWLPIMGSSPLDTMLNSKHYII